MQLRFGANQVVFYQNNPSGLSGRGIEAPPMREALIALNQLEADGVVPRYAIGGAIGASF